MSNKIQQYLRDHKYNTAPDETYSHIDEWLEWYQGDVEKFHRYKVYNGVVTTENKRYSMGMAKKLCEDWANLILNEKVSIKAGDYEKRLNEILEANNFRVRGNQLLEMMFALGTGAFVEYRDASDNVIIDYIRADMIYPLSWDNGDITECAFGTTRVIDGKENIYLQIHRLGREEDVENPELYYIENRYIEADSGKEIEPPEEIEPLVQTGYEKPLFQIITPNICNNIDLDSPLGISIYANCISQLKGCDLIYDSYVNEFILGRKRILVPISAAKMQMQKEGITAPVFDASDSVYYQMPGDRQEDLKLTEVDMAIRAQEHELGMQRSLDILSLKAGMGTGRFQFNSTGVKTATEVISDKSDLYQNLQRNEIPVKSALISMIKAVAFLDFGKEIDPTVDFDDSIIEDSNTTIDRNIKLIQAGLRSKLTAIMEIDKCSEMDAKKELERIAEDSQITGQDVDWTKGDQDESEQEKGDAGESEKEKEEKTDDSQGREKTGPANKK
ncbi:phage portal protein [Ruminococcus sp. OA3]|uniref:phage portal protein n=1 Tax=Ruminococcus sp. OA3 TaxID=2914164 RepID=UPI001F05642B|nr:phage portal protein [Ruminococcus sp. OA3]MCH1984175.1 phage portal protein [Ruminococcus sp. OA3]